jgi:hypothetical protein
MIDMVAGYILSGFLALMVLLCLWFLLAAPLYYVGVIDCKSVFGGAPLDVCVSLTIWVTVGFLSVLAAIGWFTTEVLIPLLP